MHPLEVLLEITLSIGLTLGLPTAAIFLAAYWKELFPSKDPAERAGRALARKMHAEQELAAAEAELRELSPPTP